MKILAIAPWLPYPGFSGAAIRSFHILKVLSRGHDVNILCQVHDESQEMIMSLRRMLPGVRRVDTVSMREQGGFSIKLQRIVATFHPDIVHVEGLQVAPFALPLNIPMILSEHNAEFRLCERLIAIGAADRSPDLIRELERMACARATSVIVCSKTDLLSLRTIAPEADFVLVENGVDAEHYSQYVQDTARDQPTIVFTGTMGYSPNVDAVCYFCQEIYPSILHKVPNARFLVVGSNPCTEIQQLHHRLPGVTVTGPVGDIRPYIASATVVVAPLRAGSGTRLKILEAMAMAKPVVTTSIGCEGLWVRHGRELLIGDNPSVFTDAVLQVVTQPELAARLGQAAFGLVRRRYDWSRVLQPLTGLYDGGLSVTNLSVS